MILLVFILLKTLFRLYISETDSLRQAVR